MPRANRSLTAALMAVAAGALVAACSGSGPAADQTRAPSAPASAVAGAAPVADRPPCSRPPTEPPPATPVAGSTTDHDVTSSDGTTIRVHWFPRTGASSTTPAPTVLMGPGWSRPGDTEDDGGGVVGVRRLRDVGFNVLTWDPRGFGASGGTAGVNDPDAEGRDVQVLLDWVAARPGVALDGPGDPRVGMVGGSYGGGIALTVASQDCRVDAIVPVIAWSSLPSSLHRNGIAKLGWAGVLFRAADGGRVDPHVTSALASSAEKGTMSDEDLAWLGSRGPGETVGRITAPTLLAQGTVDGLFTLDEGIANYRRLRDAGTTVSMVWFCGGHGVCLTEKEDPDRVADAALAWLRRHVMGDTGVDTGPTVEIVDQDGHRYGAADYPVPAGAPITATGSGTLALTGVGGAGPSLPTARNFTLSPLLLYTPARAPNAVNVPVEVGPAAAVVVGAPQLTLRYSGTSPTGDRPQRVFAQLVDDETGVVVGNQVTPIPLVLDGASHTTTVPLETVAFTAHPGARLTLQLTPTTVAYAEPQLGGRVTFDEITLSLPTAADLTPAP